MPPAPEKLGISALAEAIRAGVEHLGTCAVKRRTRNSGADASAITRAATRAVLRLGVVILASDVGKPSGVARTVLRFLAQARPADRSVVADLMGLGPDRGAGRGLPRWASERPGVVLRGVRLAASDMTWIATLAARLRSGPSQDPVQLLGSAYERLLEFSPRTEGDRLVLEPGDRGARRARGAYYTPQPIIDHILDQTLEPQIRTLAREGASALGLRVCDPSCGSGRFLVAAARRLAAAERGVELKAALRRAVRACVYGVDIDPAAVELCRSALWMECPGVDASAHVKVGDALVGATPELLASGVPDEAYDVRPGDDRKAARYWRELNRRERSDALRRSSSTRAIERLRGDAWCAAFLLPKRAASEPVPTQRTLDDLATGRRLSRSLLARIAVAARQAGAFHWHVEFPEICSGRGFDAIVGNPPFLNQLQTPTTLRKGIDSIVRRRTGGAIGGYADVSAAFLAASIPLCAPGGRIGLLQPQSLLAVEHAADVRAAILRACDIHSLWISGARVFEGVNVLTCAPVLRVRTQGEPPAQRLQRFLGPHFKRLPPGPAPSHSAGTSWAPLMPEVSGVPPVTVRGAGVVGDLAHATADFRDQYYGLAGFLVEDAHEHGDPRAFPPLITSGLIDLAASHWGRASTRVLKRVWAAPRVDRRAMEARGELGPWITSRLVPKLLLATQTRAIELVADSAGQLLPSTPVISVIPRDAGDLWRLAAALASPVCAAVAMHRHAGAALSPTAIKLSASQVLQLPLPRLSDAWTEAAEHMRGASEATDDAVRRTGLIAMGKTMLEAYEVSPAQRAALMTWWHDRAGLSGAVRPASRSLAAV